MFGDLLAMGVLGAVGMFFMLWRLPRGFLLKLLGVPVLVDVMFTCIMFAMHWGTFSGVMVATFAGMCGSITLSLARWVFGYKRSGYYIKGIVDARGEYDDTEMINKTEASRLGII